MKERKPNLKKNASKQNNTFFQNKSYPNWRKTIDFVLNFVFLTYFVLDLGLWTFCVWTCVFAFCFLLFVFLTFCFDFCFCWLFVFWLLFLDFWFLTFVFWLLLFLTFGGRAASVQLLVVDMASARMSTDSKESSTVALWSARFAVVAFETMMPSHAYFSSALWVCRPMTSTACDTASRAKL